MIRYLHSMVRVTDIETSLRFYCDGLGLQESRRKESETGRYTLVFLTAPNQDEVALELTYNWDPEDYQGGRNFGHLAYEVDDIYAVCQHLMDLGYTFTVHRVMAVWHSSKAPTASPLSCSISAVARPNPGAPCPIAILLSDWEE